MKVSSSLDHIGLFLPLFPMLPWDFHSSWLILYFHISVMTLSVSACGFITCPQTRVWNRYSSCFLSILGHEQKVNFTCISVSWLDFLFFLNPDSQEAFEQSRALARILTTSPLLFSVLEDTSDLQGMSGLLNQYLKYSCTFTMISWKHEDLWSLIVTSKT